MESLHPGDPARVGRYRLLGRLGAGGMGEVYLGESPSGRKVAVKVVRADHVLDDEFRARFAREVAAARRVSGFYTASVVDADTDATPPWMATSFVDGPSLAARVQIHGPLAPAEVARLGAALAEGLAAIHMCGLVHRDLKPANILLAEDGPRIIDFGIVRDADAMTLTRDGFVVGTPAYMSPEQLESEPVRPESDVFALGGVLVYAATGHSPFDADNRVAIMHNILMRPPAMAGLDGPLRAVIEECLQKAPARRPTLMVLLARLSAIAAPPADSSSAAVREPTADPQPRPVPRPAPDSSGVLLIRKPGDERLPLARIAFSPDGRLLAGAAAAGGRWRVYLWDTATGQPATGALEGSTLPGGTPKDDLAKESAAKDSAAKDSAAKDSGGKDGAAKRRGARGRAARDSAADGSAAKDSAAKGAALEDGALKGSPVAGHGDLAPDIAFSPDSRLLAVADGASVHLRRTGNWQPASLGSDATARWQAIAFAPNGWVLATVAEPAPGPGFTGTSVRLWSTATLRPVDRTFRIDSPVAASAVRFSPDGRFLLAGTSSELFLCDLGAPSLGFERVAGYNGLPGKAAFSADGLLLAAQETALAGVGVLDTISRREVARLDCGPLSLLDFSPAGHFLATATGDPGQQVIDVWPATGRPASGRRLDGFTASASALQFSPDGQLLAATGTIRPGTELIRIWRADGTWGGASITVAGPATATFSPDGRYLAVSTADQGVRLWDTRTGRSPITPGGHAVGPARHAWRAMSFSPDGRLLATTDSDGTRLWRLP